MKNLLLIISFLLFFSLNGFSQETIKLYIIDSKGQIDSVWFGINSNATGEIDSSFGEKNIYGVPFNDLDIRVVQRDSTTFNCLYKFNKIFFPKNIDLKIDFRNTSTPNSDGWNYEIILKASNYPLTIKGDFSKLKFTGYDRASKIILLDNNCNPVAWKQIISDSSFIFKISDSTYSSMIVQYSVMDKINDPIKFNIGKIIKLYPNPFTDILKIESENIPANNNLKLKIYNLLGQIEKTENNLSNNSNIILSDLKPGIYFVEIEDKTQNIYRQKIIKH